MQDAHIGKAPAFFLQERDQRIKTCGSGDDGDDERPRQIRLEARLQQKVRKNERTEKDARAVKPLVQIIEKRLHQFSPPI